MFSDAGSTSEEVVGGIVVGWRDNMVDVENEENCGRIGVKEIKRGASWSGGLGNATPPLFLSETP